MFSSHVILDFRVEDYPSLTKETEVSLFCHNQNSNFFGIWLGTSWLLNVWESLPVWYCKCWLNLIPVCGYCVCSVMSDSVTPWTAACQAPTSTGFSRQEYGTGLPFPSPGDLPDPGTKSRSPALQADSLLPEPPGKHIYRLFCSSFLLASQTFHLRAKKIFSLDYFLKVLP